MNVLNNPLVLIFPLRREKAYIHRFVTGRLKTLSRCAEYSASALRSVHTLAPLKADQRRAAATTSSERKYDKKCKQKGTKMHAKAVEEILYSE